MRETSWICPFAAKSWTRNGLQPVRGLKRVDSRNGRRQLTFVNLNFPACTLVVPRDIGAGVAREAGRLSYGSSSLDMLFPLSRVALDRSTFDTGDRPGISSSKGRVAKLPRNWSVRWCVQALKDIVDLVEATVCRRQVVSRDKRVPLGQSTHPYMLSCRTKLCQLLCLKNCGRMVLRRTVRRFSCQLPFIFNGKPPHLANSCGSGQMNPMPSSLQRSRPAR